MLKGISNGSNNRVLNPLKFSDITSSNTIVKGITIAMRAGDKSSDEQDEGKLIRNILDSYLLMYC